MKCSVFVPFLFLLLTTIRGCPFSAKAYSGEAVPGPRDAPSVLQGFLFLFDDIRLINIRTVFINTDRHVFHFVFV